MPRQPLAFGDLLGAHEIAWAGAIFLCKFSIFIDCQHGPHIGAYQILRDAEAYAYMLARLF